MIFFDERQPNKYNDFKKLLVPHILANKDKIPYLQGRYGKNDGSYVYGYTLANNSIFHEMPIDNVLSYGIGDDPEGVSFEQEMSARGKNIAMYDASIDELPADIPNATFYKEYLTEENFQHHLFTADLRHNILKMDIEGHEYKWLSDRNLELLKDNFAQFSVEVHSLIEEVPEGWELEPQLAAAKKDKQLKLDFFKKLNKHFYLFHIHGNNHGPRYVDFPDSLELTYINKKVAIVMSRDMRQYPIAGLDEANYDGREDYVLDWWV